MFRKNQRTALERSLISEGVDVSSDVGRTLLDKMIERGYSDNEVRIESHSLEQEEVLIVQEKDTQEWMAAILVYKSECSKNGASRIHLWWPYSPGAIVSGGEDYMYIYSKYDIYGKLIADV